MLANSILFSEFDRDMIHYALRCAAEHDFDGWFKSSADFERLAQGGYLSCPQCGNTAVNRGMMAPRIVGKAVAPLPTEVHPPPLQGAPTRTNFVQPSTAPNASTGQKRIVAGPIPDALRSMLARFRQEVEANCDYVGANFAEEARRIHEGEAPARGIYGEATADEAESLEADGINVARIPWVPLSDS